MRSAVRALGAPLPGPLQTIDGAEQLGLLLLFKNAPPPIAASFDASRVTDGILEGGRALAARATAACGEVWRKVSMGLDDFGGVGDEGLTIEVIRGHATVKDAREGRSSCRDRRGNIRG